MTSLPVIFTSTILLTRHLVPWLFCPMLLWHYVQTWQKTSIFSRHCDIYPIAIFCPSAVTFHPVATERPFFAFKGTGNWHWNGQKLVWFDTPRLRNGPLAIIYFLKLFLKTAKCAISFILNGWYISRLCTELFWKTASSYMPLFKRVFWKCRK